ncbi:VOC family protein [Candidatus Micrarchaeota archaeon]|nr:VOC family protein [Candidatus Micrarchaeota archaeon]
MMDSIVHFEIPVDDLDRAKKFYKDLFGWGLADVPEMNYCMVTTTESDEKGPKKPGAINGGMMKRQQKGETPVLVINVKSIDEHLKKIKAAGGKVVMEKMQVGDMGLYARVTDTEGNVIGIWQNLK